MSYTDTCQSYTECFRKMGAADLDYVQLAQRLAASTGGVNMWSHFGFNVSESKKTERHIRITLKFLDDTIGDALSVSV